MHSHCLSQYNSNYYIYSSLILLSVILMLERSVLVEGLRCFAGDPDNRIGRSQWSCDGNSFNQFSLCSNLGLLSDDSLSSRSSGPIAVFEQQQASSHTSAIHRRPPRSMDAGDDVLAEYYRAQENNFLTRGGLTSDNDKHRKRFHFGSDASDTYRPSPVTMHRRQYGSAPIDTADYNTRAGRGSAGGVVRYYRGQSKCFDGGDLGRICCCSTDFCNLARPLNRLTWQHFIPILFIEFLTIKGYF